MIKSPLLLTTLIAATALTANADEGRLLRFPATNGTDVVFSYAGDLYKAPLAGGEAKRLTSSNGYEMFARFSPDGKQIAFTGQYDGSTEVYLISADGGSPVRLTYSPTNARDDLADRMGPNNVVMAWTPDGQNIVYRNRISDGFNGVLMTISPDGGMPEQIPLPEGGFCCYSPDGKRLAYNRVFREFRTWKYYKGGMADDVWIYDPEAETVENITDNVAQDVFPMWIGDEIFYASDRDNRMNLFVYNTVTKTTEKVTDFTDYDVKFPSTDGNIIVFENGGYIYKFDPKTRQYSKIDITLNAEGNKARPELRKVKDNLTAYNIAPDGNRMVITARGEVFNVPANEGVTYNLTRSSGANDRDATWSPDGKYISYISDGTGETEVWMQPADGGTPIQLTTANDTYIRWHAWSPDSKNIIYGDRKNRLVLVDVASKSKRELLQDSISEIDDVNFSPDSRWITYTRTAPNQMQVVYIYYLTSGNEYPVTEDWYNSTAPAFSSDGKYLLYAGARDLNPIYSYVEWNYAYTEMDGIYMVMLANDTPSPLLPTNDKVAIATNDNQEDGNDDKKESDNAVKIDTDRLAQRTIKLPVGTGNYFNIYCDGNKVWYNDGPVVKVLDLKEQDETTALELGVFEVSADGKKAAIYKYTDRSISICDFPASDFNNGKSVNLDDMTAYVEYDKEWAQIYDEAWRAYRDGFYLENMHGVDWAAMKEKYAALLPYVKCRQDLSYVIGGLIGELATGHAYVGPGGDDNKGVAIVKTGLLGAKLSRDNDTGFFRIDEILEGAPYRNSLISPLAQLGLGVNEGDYIVAIDGIPTNSTTNIYNLLVGKAGVMTELSINSSATLDGAKRIVVEPIDNEYPLYHYAWVQNNIKKVEEATDGRVGYIYIPDMGPEGLNEFVRYYYPQLNKEALIIDDRGNGGGNISPMVIERLLRTPYRMTMYRGSAMNGTIPEGTHYGPKVLLINKYSASDGDLFPWSFKAVGLGTVIGTRTWGGIVGITSPLQYIDGTDIRVPFFTNYDARTGKWIVENHGVDPDIYVDNDPVKEYAGIDQQLNKAIEVALEQLKSRKPLPKTPAPRTLQDLGVK